MKNLSLLCVAMLVISGCPKREETDADASGPRQVARAPAEKAPEMRPASSFDATAFAERKTEREALVAYIQTETLLSDRVLSAMRRVPRHAFVPDSVSEEAYADRPLPIGYGQTISQPQVVASMTELAEPKASDKCLEIGTGSGYQAAILAELCQSVYTIEYVEALARFGEKNLRKLGYGEGRVHVRSGDGYRGWPEAAPFDVIMVTAAPERVPKPLLEQLAVGGRLVIPVGPTRGVQQLEKWVRKAQGQGPEAFERSKLMAVRFVPFVGEAEREP